MSSEIQKHVDSEVLVRVEGVSKKFCRSLKKSLWYGLCDIAGELSPKRREARGKRQEVEGDEGETGLRDGEFWAVNDVSFELRRGECLGLIGHNGAGKTTLLKMLNGLIKPDEGKITMRGRIGAVIALGAGFNPILTGRENIYINGAVLGLSKKQIDEKIDDIIDFAEVREFIDMPVQSYSSGMNVRLGFAVATAMDPDVLLLDEVLAVGDAKFRSKCFQRIGAIMEKCAVIFVSHDAYSIHRICDRVLWMKRGKQMFLGATDEGMELYGADAPTAGKLDAESVISDYLSNIKCNSSVTQRQVTQKYSVADLHVSLTFDSSRQVELGLCVAVLYAAGEEGVGQLFLDEVFEKVKKGSNNWNFVVRDLSLAEGKYGLVITVFEKGSKSLVMTLRHAVTFSVEGNPRIGAKYLPIAQKVT